MHFRNFGSMLGVVLVLGFSSFIFPLEASSAEKLGENWQSDLQSAHAAAIESKRPILLVFGSEFCPHCRNLESRTLTQNEVAYRIIQQFIPLYLDYHQHREAAKILNIQALPTTVILSPDSHLLGRREGFMTVKQIQTLFDQSIRTQKQLVGTP